MAMKPPHVVDELRQGIRVSWPSRQAGVVAEMFDSKLKPSGSACWSNFHEPFCSCNWINCPCE